MIRITLPFPATELFPNRSKGRHWASLSAVRASALNAGYTLTYQAVSKHRGPWPDLTKDVPLTLTFCQPDKRGRDADNMLAAAKHLLDGVATALTVNDKRFSPITIKRGEVVKGGALVVEIGE